MKVLNNEYTRRKKLDISEVVIVAQKDILKVPWCYNQDLKQIHVVACIMERTGIGIFEQHSHVVANT